MIEHRPGDPAVSGQEDDAISEIDAAIQEIKHAAFDDGKDLRDPVGVDAPVDRPGRLHRSVEVLRKVRDDVAREKDDPQVRGLRDRALQHADAAPQGDACRHRRRTQRSFLIAAIQGGARPLDPGNGCAAEAEESGDR